MIAIDFGTSNTIVAHDRDGALYLAGLSRSATNPSIPSVVHVVAPDQITIGQAALEIPNHEGLFRNFKRGIGLNVPGFVPHIGGVAITPTWLGERFMQTVVAAVQARFPEEKDWVITVPVDSFEAYRRWLAGTLPQLERLQIIDEPTAAALGWAEASAATWLLIDLGGGTLDVVLVELDAAVQKGGPLGTILRWGQAQLRQTAGHQARVLAKTAQTLGGADFDQWLAEWWCARAAADYDNRDQFQTLTPDLVAEAEAVKIALSSTETAGSGLTQTSRAELEQVLRDRDLWGQLDRALATVLTGRTPDKVIAVGASFAMPALRQWLEARFAGAQLVPHQPEAIATGALKLRAGLTLRDTLYHSYGIRYWNHARNQHDWHPLIQAGMPYPLPQPVELVLGASLPNQPSVELLIGELGNAASGVAVYFENGQLMTRQQGEATEVQALNEQQPTLARLDPLGQPGQDRLRLRFQIDAQRRLCVSIEDLLTHRELLRDQPIINLR